MALPQGINFRNSSGFVTDGANEFWCTDVTSVYPTTSTQGQNVGWEDTTNTGGGAADRNSGIDRRLAGIAYQKAATGQRRFRIDLPSTGSYNVRCAVGDNGGGTDSKKLELFDTTTSLGVLVSDGTFNGSSTSYDATNTSYSSAAWPGSNTAAAATFASTICRFKIGGSGADFYVVQHIYIEAGSSGTNVSATTGVETWNGRTATLGLATNVAGTTGVETWNGKTASITTGNGVSATTGVETWNGRQANINAAINITAVTGVETWNGRTGTIGASINLLTTPGTETWNGRTATVNVSGPTTITTSLSSEIWGGYAATVTPGGGAGVRRNRVFGSKKHVTYRPS